MPTAKQDKTRKNGLTVKDLIVMGVFGALLMVCSMIGGVLFAVTPTLTFYFSIGAALLPGPVFLLLLAKVPKRWGLTIIGVIISLLVFDEPTSGLDYDSMEQVSGLIRELSKQIF